jgi:hypothetical protein
MHPSLTHILSYKNNNVIARYENDYPKNKMKGEEAFRELLKYIWPNEFYRFWELIEHSLQPEGVFSGTFFGVNDSWREKHNMTILERDAIHALFRHFKIESLEEIETDELNMLGNLKHWHIYFVVAKKY